MFHRLIIGILIFCNITFSLYSQEPQSYTWKGYKVFFKPKKSEDVTEPSILVLKNSKTGKVFQTISYDYGTHSIAGYYKTKDDVFLHISGYSGGESGCCSIDEFYYIVKRPIKIKKVSFEQLSYSPFTVVDMDGDGVEEFMNYSTAFYGYTLDDKKLTQKNFTFKMTTQQLYLAGFHDVFFPVYRVLQKGKKGYTAKDVTFEKKYIKALKPYILKAEQALDKDSGKTFSSEDWFQGYFQYFYYMHKIGKEERAIDKVKKTGIQITFYSEGQTNSTTYLLSDILAAYKDELMKNQ